MKTLITKITIALIFSVLLSACSDSSSDNNSSSGGSNTSGSDSTTGGGDTDLSPGTAGVTGSVVDAINGAPLPGVEISVDGLPQTSLSNSSGSYTLDSLPNNVAVGIRVSLEGYVSEVYRTPILNPTPEDTFNRLELIMLVPDNDMGAGGIGGTISDSQGNLLAGAVLRFLSGINASEGTAVASTVTDAQGFWTIAGLSAGNYTCIIEIEGQDPVFETVQILGGVENVSADFVVTDTTPPQINFPPEGTRDDYGAGEVAWNYDRFIYEAAFGEYSVVQDDNIGSLSLRHFSGLDDVNPISYRESNIILSHTFAGPGDYSVVDSRDQVVEAAEASSPARVAFIRVVATGPRGTVGPARFESYATTYAPSSLISGGGNISVSVDVDGRFVFDIEGLELVISATQFLEVHPDAPESIIMNLSNGNAP